MEMKKYKIVYYIRVEPEEAEPLTYSEAVVEKVHLDLLQPENIYKIEKIEGD